MSFTVGANLEDACLDEANLANANLQGASLRGTSLQNAVLDGADLRKTHDLTREQVESARSFKGARFPAHLAHLEERYEPELEKYLGID